MSGFEKIKEITELIESYSGLGLHDKLDIVTIGNETISLKKHTNTTHPHSVASCFTPVVFFDSAIDLGHRGLIDKYYKCGKPDESVLVLTSVRLGIGFFESAVKHQQHLDSAKSEEGQTIVELGAPYVKRTLFECDHSYHNYVGTKKPFDAYPALKKLHEQFEDIVYPDSRWSIQDIMLHEELGRTGNSVYLGMTMILDGKYIHFYFEAESRYGVYLGL